MNKDYKVTKANFLINFKFPHKYLTNEIKLICHLISHILPSDTNFETKKIQIKDLHFINEFTNNHKYYDELCNNLMKKPFKLPESHLNVNWFSALGYKDGYIEYAFDTRLKPFLLELKGNFTQYYLSNILNLKSSYSIQIFELLSQTRNLGGRTIYIDNLREILNIPKSYLNADIKRLLISAQKDLRENTNMQFLFSLEKEGRKFNKIKFLTKRNKKIQGVSYE